jgi:hypothetical protein
LVFAGGVGMGCWSLLARIVEYWFIALAAALVGQGLLILGLVMVATRLWRESRLANSRLQEMHGQLHQVQRTAETIVGLRNGSAPAFFAELARGSSPQLLLASLRGQLDQLAARMASDG